VFDDPIVGDSFTIYLEKVVLRSLKPSDIGIVGNLGSHKDKAVGTIIRSVGAKLFFLPKYSSDPNSIEQFPPCPSTCAKQPGEPSGLSRPLPGEILGALRLMNPSTVSKTQDTPQLRFILLVVTWSSRSVCLVSHDRPVADSSERTAILLARDIRRGGP
jgi:hypothetical protein